MTLHEIDRIARVIREQVRDVESQIHTKERTYDLPFSQWDPVELGKFHALHQERDRLYNLTVCMVNALEEFATFSRNHFFAAAFSGEPDSLTT